MKKFGLILGLVLISFIFSLFDFKGINFLLVIPLLVLSLIYDKRYVISVLSGMFIAAFVVDYNYMPKLLLFSTIISAIFLIIGRKTRIDIKHFLPIVSMVFSFSFNVFLYVDKVSDSIINILLVPAIMYFITYQLVELRYDLSSKETFSVTKKQLYFIAFLANFYLSTLIVENLNFHVGLVIVGCLNYVFIKLDPLAGILGCSTALLLDFSSGTMIGIFTLIPLIFIIKALRESNYFKGVVYLGINALVFMYFKDSTLLLESLLISIFLLIVPNKSYIYLNKYVVEPQDYELKLYQQSYYKCLNRNKRIQKVMGLLENQIKENPKMKKHSRELLHKNMQFLTNKLKEEENIRIKEIILNNLKYKGIEVLSMKLHSDYFSNYQVDLEIKETGINTETIIEILQENLQVKLSLYKKTYNKLINTKTLTISNDERTQFNLLIKQRSKEMNTCGDSYVTFNVKNKKYLLISDGMGHGKKANKQANNALLLLKEFIELGMGAKDAIISCNALLYSKENESFNTLDLLEYDIYDNELFLYKNGSGCTYLKNALGVDKINSENLPLGIVEEIKVEKIKLDADMDYIVLTSDGFKKDLSKVIGSDSSAGIKELVQEIFEYEGDNIEDDQTIALVSVINLD